MAETYINFKFLLNYLYEVHILLFCPAFVFDAKVFLKGGGKITLNPNLPSMPQHLSNVWIHRILNTWQAVLYAYLVHAYIRRLINANSTNWIAPFDTVTETYKCGLPLGCLHSHIEICARNNMTLSEMFSDICHCIYRTEYNTPVSARDRTIQMRS